MLSVICSDGELTACPQTATLVFTVSGDQVSGFLSAYAEPLGPEAERVWYFSKESGSLELDVPADGTRVFQRAVRISPTHPPGRYRVHAFLADRPLGHDEMLAEDLGAAVRSTLQAELVVAK